MSWNNTIPIWVIQASMIQDEYRDGDITYEQAVLLMEENKLPPGCFEALKRIKDEKESNDDHPTRH